MDKAEYQAKLDDIKSLVKKKDYKSAMEIVDGIEWRRVKSIRTLCTVGEIYAANKRYKDSREIFLLAYHRSPVGKTILYRLIEVCIKMGNLDEALEYYSEFVEAAPNDSTRYILKYKIYSARNASIEEQIQILEEYKEKEFTERWSYELARLYYKAGENDKCIEICDDLFLWFSEGKYVVKALDLKKRITELTPSQEKAYDVYFNPIPKLNAVPEVGMARSSAEEPQEKTSGEDKEAISQESIISDAGEENLKEIISQESVISDAGEENLNEIISQESVVSGAGEEDQQEAISQESVISGADDKEPVEDSVLEDTVEENDTVDEPVKPKADIKDILDDIVLATPVIDTDENFQEKISKGIKDIFNTSSGKKKKEEEIQEEELVEKQITGQLNIVDILGADAMEQDTPPLEPENITTDNLPKLNIPEMNFTEKVKVEDLPISMNLEDTILAAAMEQGIELPDVDISSHNMNDSAEEKIEKQEENDTEVTFAEEITEDKPSADELVKEINPSDIPVTEESVEEISSVDTPIEESLEEAEESTDAIVDVQDEMAESEEENIVMPDLEEQVISALDEKISEEEKLMRFIDAQNVNPDADPQDIIPREDKLDDEEVKLFSYFSSIPGLREQIVEALKDTQMAAADKTSSSGNVIIMGNRTCGKTTLANALIRAICRELNMAAAKIASVEASALNGQDIPRIINKLSGGFLLIHNTSQLSEESVESLNKAMEFRTDGLTVMLEDEKISMRKFISKYGKFTDKFTSTISIPVFTNDELVSFAKVYTADLGYKIDDMAILALYTLISNNQKEDEPMTVGGVKILIDNAIAKAESGTRKLKRNIAKTRTDGEGNILLHEKDFK